MTSPTVHLNGTSAEELSRQYDEAFQHLSRAADKLGQSAPHGRDYYVQGDGALRAAQAEHAARVRKLREVLDELTALHEAVQSQVDAREARRR